MSLDVGQVWRKRFMHESYNLNKLTSPGVVKRVSNNIYSMVCNNQSFRFNIYFIVVRIQKFVIRSLVLWPVSQSQLVPSIYAAAFPYEKLQSNKCHQTCGSKFDLHGATSTKASGPISIWFLLRNSLLCMVLVPPGLSWRTTYGGFCVFCIVDWHRWVTPSPQKWYTEAVDDARLSVTLQPTYAKAHACLD